MAQAVANGSMAGARKPSDIPPAGWFQILKRTYAESTRDNVSLVAADEIDCRAIFQEIRRRAVAVRKGNVIARRR